MANGLFEEPLVFITMLLAGVWVALDPFYSRAGIVLSFLILGAYVMYKEFKQKFRINSVKRNTFKNIGIALVGVGLTAALSLALAKLVGFGSVAISEFFSNARSTVLGAQVSPLQGNPIVEFILFIIAFPVVESIVAMVGFLAVGKSYGAKFTLTDIPTHLAAGTIGVFAIIYHIFAKSIATGSPNTNILVVMFLIFYVECLIVTYAKEIEPAIYHHIINNALAMGGAFFFGTLFGYPLFFISALLILAILNAGGVKRLWRRIT